MPTILRPLNSALMAFEYFGVEVAPKEANNRVVAPQGSGTPNGLNCMCGSGVYDFCGTREVLDVGQSGNHARGCAVSS